MRETTLMKIGLDKWLRHWTTKPIYQELCHNFNIQIIAMTCAYVRSLNMFYTKLEHIELWRLSKDFAFPQMNAA